MKKKAVLLSYFYKAYHLMWLKKNYEFFFFFGIFPKENYEPYT